jgi:hypothetical protein
MTPIEPEVKPVSATSLKNRHLSASCSSGLFFFSPGSAVAIPDGRNTNCSISSYDHCSVQKLDQDNPSFCRH